MTQDAPAPNDGRVDILLVDDREEDLLVLTTVLAGPEYNLVTARSGTEALRQVLAREFAVILVDVFMPIMDGFEVAAVIKERERSRNTPLIFLTADTSDLRKIYRGYSVGAVDYLQKPVDPDVVRAKVAVFADLFRKDQRLRQQGEALQAAERRERELRLNELRLSAERRYRNLADAIPQIVWTASHDGMLDYANRCWMDYTGLEHAATRDLGWLAAVHPDDVAQAREAWLEAVAVGSRYAMECRLRRHDGTFRWHVCRAVPERSADGTVEAWLGTYSDFEDLKQAIQARDEFLVIASHELRTPLTALKLRLQAVLRDVTLDEKPRSGVQRALRQAERLERLIVNLLDVSRITTGNLQIEPEPIDLVDLVRETVERFADQLAQYSTRIDLSGESSLRGEWDRMRIEQVVTNLLSNAVRYSDGKPIDVHVCATEIGAEVSVKDRGPGIAQADLERIFQRFERTATPHDRAGLGVGLFIARRIVERHGGALNAYSALGSGAEFRMTLPHRAGNGNGSFSGAFSRT